MMSQLEASPGDNRQIWRALSYSLETSQSLELKLSMAKSLVHLSTSEFASSLSQTETAMSLS